MIKKIIEVIKGRLKERVAKLKLKIIDLLK